MNVQAMTLLFGLLAAVANIAVLSFTVVATAARLSPRAARLRDRLWDLTAPVALPMAALVGLTATLGSLYYSEIQHYVPCNLCWFQRIAMYPMPVILGIASWRRDHEVRRYVIPVALIGAAISIYHYQLEWFPTQTALGCPATGVPCSAPYFRQFGFMSLAYLALSGFLVISWLAWIAGQRRDQASGDVGAGD